MKAAMRPVDPAVEAEKARKAAEEQAQKES